MLERFPSSLRGAFSETILKAERGVASRDCGANRSAGGPGPRPPSLCDLARAGRWSAPVPLPETAARVPGRKSPRWSAERASRLQRDAPRSAHAVVAPRTRDITEECACRRSIHPWFGVAVRTRDEKEDQPGRRNAGAGEGEKRRARGREETVAWSRAPRACPFARTCGLFDIVNEREELSAAGSSRGTAARARCAACRRSPPSARPRRSRPGP